MMTVSSVFYFDDGHPGACFAIKHLALHFYFVHLKYMMFQSNKY